MLIGGAWGVFWRNGDFFVSEDHNNLFIIELLITLLNWYCWYQAFYSDPGFVKPHHFRQPNRYYDNSQDSTGEEADKFKECVHCQCVKINLPEKNLVVNHCSQCGHCVFGMDHHCSFTNNCVGIGNTKFFILFNFFICVQVLVGIIVMIKYAIVNNLTDQIYVYPHQTFFMWSRLALKTNAWWLS